MTTRAGRRPEGPLDTNPSDSTGLGTGSVCPVHTGSARAATCFFFSNILLGHVDALEHFGGDRKLWPSCGCPLCD